MRYFMIIIYLLASSLYGENFSKLMELKEKYKKQHNKHVMRSIKANRGFHGQIQIIFFDNSKNDEKVFESKYGCVLENIIANSIYIFDCKSTKNIEEFLIDAKKNNKNIRDIRKYQKYQLQIF